MGVQIFWGLRHAVSLEVGLTRFSIAGESAYVAMKGAIEVLTRYLAKELSPRGIAVNVSRPARSRPTSAAAACATTPT